MANFGQLVLTNSGLQEQYKAQSGQPLTFKRIAMGSGEYSGNIATLTALVTENVSINVAKGYIQNNTFVVEGFFSNESLQTGFAWREIGLFAEDAEGNEVLYCYANAGDTYDYIPATTDERYSKYIRIATAIGNATNVTIAENDVPIYVDTVTFNTKMDELEKALEQELGVLGHKFTISGNIEDMDSMKVYTAGIVYSTANGVPDGLTNGYGITYSLGYNDNYQIQRIMKRPSGEMYERIRTVDGFTDWIEIYNTLNPPTASKVGAAEASTHNLKTYTTLEQLGLTPGNETIETILSSMPNFSLLQIATSSQNNMSIYPSAYGGTLIVEKSYGNRAKLTYFAQTKEWIGHYFNNVWYGWIMTFDENNLPTAEQVGALPLDGSEKMTGSLKIKDYGEIDASNTLTYLKSIKDINNFRYLRIINPLLSDYTKEKAIQWGNVVAGSEKTYSIHGEHNKPGGSYSGSGTTTKRTVETDGIGYCILIWRDSIFSIVTPIGAICYHTGNNTSVILPSSKVSFIAGTLTIATDDSGVNGSGKTYSYQVL